MSDVITHTHASYTDACRHLIYIYIYMAHDAYKPEGPKLAFCIFTIYTFYFIIHFIRYILKKKTKWVKENRWSIYYYKKKGTMWVREKIRRSSLGSPTVALTSWRETPRPNNNSEAPSMIVEVKSVKSNTFFCISTTVPFTSTPLFFTGIRELTMLNIFSSSLMLIILSQTKSRQLYRMVLVQETWGGIYSVVVVGFGLCFILLLYATIQVSMWHVTNLIFFLMDRS